VKNGIIIPIFRGSISMQKNCKIRINLKGDFEQELSESEKKAARVKPALTNLDFDKFVCKLKENR
jgi:hypothetical protein